MNGTLAISEVVCDCHAAVMLHGICISPFSSLTLFHTNTHTHARSCLIECMDECESLGARQAFDVLCFLVKPDWKHQD